jgi:hypothetical protein
MNLYKSMRVMILTLCVANLFFQASPLDASHDGAGIRFSVPSFVRIKADKSSITLKMQDFSRNSLSNEESVTYVVAANDVTLSRNVVMVKLDDRFENVELQVKFLQYERLHGNASLVAAKASWLNVRHKRGRGVANKITHQGSGKLIHGRFDLKYRASAKKDLPSGEQLRNLTVTIIDS